MPNNLVLPSPAGSNASSTSLHKMRTRSSSSALSPASPLSRPAALSTLIFGKASRVFATFVSFHYLQDKVALPLYLFFVTLGAASVLLLVQRPWHGKRIGPKRFKRLLSAAALLVATLYIWTAGLRSAGPLRTLLVDGAELPLLYLFALLTRREMPERRKTRGALCMLLAYLLLIWDASGHVPDVSELERSKFGQRAELMVDRLKHRVRHDQYGRQVNEDFNAGFVEEGGHMGGGDEHKKNKGIKRGGGGRRRLLSSDNQLSSAGAVYDNGDHDNNNGLHDTKIPSSSSTKTTRRRLLTTFRPPVKGPGGVKDAFVEGTALRCEFGVILVLLASVLVQGGRGFSRRLATELGGAKRHFALSMAVAVVWMAPLALLSWLSNATGAVLSLQAVGGITSIDITSTHILGFLAVGFLWLVLPYYARAVVSTTLPSRTMMQAAVAAPFVMAALASGAFGAAARAGGLSWVLVMAFLLECVGVSLMMAGGANRAGGLSELPIDANAAAPSAGGGSAVKGGPKTGGANGSGTGAMANGGVATASGNEVGRKDNA